MGMTLYEIDSQIKGIIDTAFDTVDENGEIQVDFEALEQLKEDRNTKLENIALYIKNIEAESAAIKAEEEKLAKRRKSLENKADGLSFLLLRSLVDNNERSFSTARCSAKLRNSERTEIDNVDLIPDRFIEIKTERKPDKKAIKEAIKAGEEVAGARVVANVTIKID